MGRPLVEIQNLTKSFNEALILSSLAEGHKHGYQLALDIMESSGGLFGFNHGTLYPILHKLEKDGLIKGSWDIQTQRRKRKNYSLTPKGIKYAKYQKEAWRDFIRSFSEIIGVELS